MEIGLTLFSAERILGFILLGFLTGGYGTLIGAGGGFVLMPLLLLIYPNQSPEALTSISLAVVFFNALSGSEAYAFMERIDYRSGLLFSLFTIPGAVIGALNTSHVPRSLFDGIFGLLLLAGSVFLLLHPDLTPRGSGVPVRPGKHRTTRHLVEADGSSHTYSFSTPLGMTLSFFVGYLS
ncbi:MAG: sulfite exporter TauE/SafE family protein, partial [bacterium]